jgi:predicted transport protein
MFKKVSWKILSVCMQNPTREFSFSDFLKITRSGPTNVHQAVKDLRPLFSYHKHGTRTLYKLDLDNYFVKSLFLTYSWEKVNFFPPKIVLCLKTLLDKSQLADAIYVFGSAVYSKKPNDFDVAVIYDKNRPKFESIWKEIKSDFLENVDVHFISRKDFISMFKEGNYRITSTLQGCLVLHDRGFIFEYLGKLPKPEKDFLLEQINQLQNKLKKCFTLYHDSKKKCTELLNNMESDFLRVYIGFKGDIPGSKNQLQKQSSKLGLNLKKRDLWETLEWMEKILRKIKNI